MMIPAQIALFLACLATIVLLGRHGWRKCRREGYTSLCAGSFSAAVVGLSTFLLLIVTPNLFPVVAVHALPGIVAMLLALGLGLIGMIALWVVKEVKETDRQPPSSPSE